MNEVIKYESFLLTKNVKQTFEENYLKMLFEKHRELPRGEVVEFIHKCQQTGANPSLSQIFLIERNINDKGVWKKTGTTVFSYNFVQAIANQTKEYEGYTTETFVANKFCIKTMTEIKMLCSKSVVKRNGHSFPYTAWFDEYVQINKDGMPNGTWSTKPYMMLEKCSLSGALRRAFPEALSGIYCEEEMESITNELDKNFLNKEIETKSLDKLNLKEIKSEQAEDFDEISNKIEKIKEMLSFICAGKSPKDKIDFLLENCGVKKFDDLKKKTLAEINDIFNIITKCVESLIDSEKNKQNIIKQNYE